MALSKKQLTLFVYIFMGSFYTILFLNILKVNRENLPNISFVRNNFKITQNFEIIILAENELKRTIDESNDILNIAEKAFNSKLSNLIQNDKNNKNNKNDKNNKNNKNDKNNEKINIFKILKMKKINKNLKFEIKNKFNIKIMKNLQNLSNFDDNDSILRIFVKISNLDLKNDKSSKIVKSNPFGLIFNCDSVQNLKNNKFWEKIASFYNELFLIKEQKIFNFKPNTKLSFTLMNYNYSDQIFIWDFEKIFNQYLKKFTKKLNFLGLETTSQIVLGGEISKSKFSFIQKYDSFFIKKYQLRSFIGKTSWNSETQTNKNEKIFNFLIFLNVGKKIKILTKNEPLSTEFLVPNWGGVKLMNILPPKNSSKNFSSEKFNFEECFSDKKCVLSNEFLREGVESFLVQFRTVLGLRSVYRSADFVLDFEKDSVFDGVSQFEINSLLLNKAKKYSNEFLEKLSTLYDQYQNIKVLPVEKSVADSIKLSLFYFKKAKKYCKKSKIEKCVKSLSKAIKHTTDASFAPSTLAKMYFSAHYIACVFAPLFATSFLPVLFEILKFVKFFKIVQLTILSKLSNFRE